MPKRLALAVTLASLVALAAAACGGGDEVAPAPQRPSPPPPPPAPAAPAPAPAPAAPAAPAPSGGIAVAVNLEDPPGSGEYQFDPADFSFNVGDTVTFSLAAESEFHTFTVDDLGIDVSVDGGTTENLSFTFDTPGTYELICIPHEALGMVGTITVAGSAAAPPPAAARTATTVDLKDTGGRGPFTFDPADFTFNAGETVDFTLVGESQFHTFTVDELGIDQQVGGGETVSFSFTFDTPGTYDLICIPHQALGMVGTITVAGVAAPAPAPPPAAARTATSVDLKDAGGPGPFTFEPADFTFNIGEAVDFTLVGESQFHTFTVDGLGIDKQVGGGETVSFSFTFDTPGTYELICIPHQALGMVGTITVR